MILQVALEEQKKEITKKLSFPDFLRDLDQVEKFSASTHARVRIQNNSVNDIYLFYVYQNAHKVLSHPTHALTVYRTSDIYYR